VKARCSTSYLSKCLEAEPKTKLNTSTFLDGVSQFTFCCFHLGNPVFNLQINDQIGARKQGRSKFCSMIEVFSLSFIDFVIYLSYDCYLSSFTS